MGTTSSQKGVEKKNCQLQWLIFKMSDCKQNNVWCPHKKNHVLIQTKQKSNNEKQINEIKQINFRFVHLGGKLMCCFIKLNNEHKWKNTDCRYDSQSSNIKLHWTTLSRCLATAACINACAFKIIWPSLKYDSYYSFLVDISQLGIFDLTREMMKSILLRIKSKHLCFQLPKLN